MKLKVGLVQDSPVFFDKERTLDKMEALIKNGAAKACNLLVFPESFVPGYPRGFLFGARVGSRTAEGKALYAKYYKNSMSLDGKEMTKLLSLAKEHNLYLVAGITEKQEQHNSLYCSMVYISPTDGLLGVHRKIKPTGTERVIWAEAAGESLVSFDTKIGKLGGLICWENYMPLARMSMFKKGVEIYIAPTADSREEWTATMKHIALEGRCFVLGCNQHFTKSMYPEEYQALAQGEPEDMCPGGSIIVSPFGKVLAGPLFGKADLLTAVLDLDEIVHSKMDFDVNGHYSRKDIFDFKVNNQPEIQKEKNL
ncbi:carbon-nitrogen hydrolase family protein [Croceitalea marina]|uniref:Carbon-nitrogen hydrolase family protein n=1 Tax=Croceitalea marina TaxID=1775166 RepID=A0ABW5MUN9_9FLAO